MAGSHKAGHARGGSRKGAAGAPPARRRRRSRLRLVLALLVSLLVLAVAGAGWLYLQLNGDIRTFDDGGVSGDRPAASAKGQNVLVIGSDSRAGDNERYGHGDGDIGRSDTAFLMHVHADHQHATAVSIPRDTLVDVPPCRLPDGTWTKTQHNVMFNSAFSVGDTAKGNPACTQNTVEKLTGLRVDHTVVVDFAGFAKMTEAVGGVQVCVPKDIYQGDLNPNLHARGERLFTKGVQGVSGQKALDYVRIRHGIGDGSDIGRIQRQQAFIASLMKKVKSRGLSPTTLFPLAKAATASMTVDPGLGSADKLISFALSMKSIDLHNTKFVTLPWRYEGARVAIVKPQADALFAALRADRTVDGEDAGGKQEQAQAASPSTRPSPSAPPSGAGVSVAVYNGTTTKGLAARAADSLKAGGYTVTGTATAATQDFVHTVIEYGPGSRAHADALAQRFPGALLRPTKATGLSVTLGSKYADAPSDNAPAAVPSEVADKARSADDNICSGLSYG
ncbi:LCP family protein [Streptomyces sp. TLI_146]|uniref:LCP family protein n=1 Tax=Streptomyces sp. TLI_146 TaxID=1938858 RepID=UPI000C704F6E|nr:LCP family protein [Streptomyces sp. TLI_146]PKV86547.1 LytR family transcriptional attenuator [Streptomyces sp. TLI_146]